MFILASILEFYHVLNQVVAIRIFDKLADIFDNVVGEFKLLVSGPLLKASLHHATSMFVLANRHTILNACLENEISVRTCLVAANKIIVLRSLSCLEHHQKRLNNVISMHINCKIEDVG